MVLNTSNIFPVGSSSNPTEVNGQHLCPLEKSISHKSGTYVYNEQIYASKCGVVQTFRGPDGKTCINVKGLGNSQILPSEGKLVACKVNSVNSRISRCSIMCVEETVLSHPFKALLKKEHVRATEVDKVELHKCFRPGDIILARVRSLADNQTFVLSTAENELGVVIAKSEAGFTPRGDRGRGRGGFGGGRGRGGGDRGGFRGGGRGGGTPRGRGGDRGRGRGGGRGGRGGMRGGRKVVIEPHRHKGVFIARGKEDALVTRNMVPGDSVYGEKRISTEASEGTEKIEYRAWNPFRSKLAAAIISGVDNIFIEPGAKVLYLGAASGTTVSHVSDIVGENGLVYAVEFSHRSGRDLLNVASKRPNIIPIIEDARHPHKYRMLLGMVDTIFADVAQPDQARIVALNAHQFLKNNGHVVISIKANCIDSTAAAEAVFAGELNKLKSEKIKPIEQVTLEPYERDHAVICGRYRASK